MDCSLTGSSVHGDSPGKNTGVACHSLLQGIFPTQGLNLCLLHWQEDCLPLNPQGSPGKTNQDWLYNLQSLVCNENVGLLLENYCEFQMVAAEH